jgi:hypothetical protein
VEARWGRAGSAAVVAVIAAASMWAASPAMAAAVTNLDDSGSGSLRQAIINANGGPPVVIDFAPGLTGLINLTSGPLTITNSMSIEGPGAGVLEVDGNGTQAITVAASSTVSISGLRFGGGVATSQGGAISNAGTLTVSDATFDHNAAGGAGSSSISEGGAIYNSGTLTVNDSTFTDNTAGGAGGTGNTSGAGAGEGGAIFNANSGSLTVTGSTFTGNTAGGDGGVGLDSGQGVGGAVGTGAGGSLTLSDSTITQNTAGGAPGGGGMSGVGQGGGVGIGNNVTATLAGDTIDANAVGSAAGSAGAGVDNANGTVSIVGTIVASNTGPANCASTNAMSASFSLEGPAGQTSCGFDLPSADPLLMPLADNGGATETQALGAGSPAIGAVTSGPDCVGNDQRGAGRTSAHCDVGAYEVAVPYFSVAQAVGVGTASATLFVPVANPDVQPGTVTFQYGTSPAYGSSTPPAALSPNGAPPFSYFAMLNGLTPGTVYHYRVVASNPDGTVFGPDQQFTTSSPATPPPPPPANTFTFGKVSVGPRGKITLPVVAPDAGRFVAKATFTVRRTVITHRHGKRVVKHVTTRFTYGVGSVTSTGSGRFRLVIGLKPKAAREFKLFSSRQVTIAVTFTPSGGTAREKSKKLTVFRGRKGKYR